MKKLLTLPLMLLSLWALAQNGKIAGKVKDTKDGLALTGVTVLVKGSEPLIVAVTDLDGAYVLDKVPAGTHTVVFQYISYQTLESQVEVKPGQTTTYDAGMSEVVNELGAVKVRANITRKVSTEATLEAQQKAPSMGSVIASDEIQKSPIKSTSGVIGKISGASIQDNKFAIIRGLNDRYNAALINGAPLPSSESDRKAFSFDIFPAVLLDNMLITKTATPDMPSEFAGGLIQITTRDIPDTNFYSLSIGGSYNTLTTFQPFKSYQGGKLDWLGIDDGTRSLPSNLPSSEDYIRTPKTDKLAYSKSFKNNFGITENKTALPNLSLQYTMAHRFMAGKKEAGSIFAVTYNNSLQFRNVEINDFAQNRQLVNTYLDDQYNRNVLWAALWNLTLRTGEKSKISLKNTFSVNSNDQTVIRNGQDVQAQTDKRIYGLYYQQNKLFTSQLIGDHSSDSNRYKFTWVLGYSNIDRDIPDFRRIKYTRPAGSSEGTPWTAFFTTNASPEDGGRFYSKLMEQSYSANYDLLVNLKGSRFPSKLKVGGFSQLRSRDFDVRVLGYTRFKSSTFNDSLSRLSLEQIFDPANMNPNGFVVQESTNKSDQYTAKSVLQAGYFMFDSRYKVKYRLVYGARIEYFNQILNSEVNGRPLEINTKKVDVLPSLNFTYAATEKSNWRFAWSQTLSRPEFRELAPFSFFDFNQFIEVVGYDSLRRAKINNIDLKYELFPSAGHIISGSLFYKSFKDPIEQVLGSDIGGGTLASTYRNAKSASNYGAEVELRHSLAFVRKTAFWSGLTFTFNAAYIYSRVDVSNVAGAKARPLQGQSPYVINTGLTYTDTARKWNLSVNYNRVGKRISFVGTDVYPNFYERPRDIVDLQISKTIRKNLDVRLTISDLLAQELIVYQNPVGDTNTNFEVGRDNVMRRYTYGRTVGIAAGYRF